MLKKEAKCSAPIGTTIAGDTSFENNHFKFPPHKSMARPDERGLGRF